MIAYENQVTKWLASPPQKDLSDEEFEQELETLAKQYEALHPEEEVCPRTPEVG